MPPPPKKRGEQYGIKATAMNRAEEARDRAQAAAGKPPKPRATKGTGGTTSNPVGRPKARTVKKTNSVPVKKTFQNPKTRNKGDRYS